MTEQKAVKGPAMTPDEAAGTVTGAQSLIKSLESAGAENIFGIPGGAILPAYDPLFDSQDPAHPGAPRAGRRPRRAGLRRRHRQGRRLHGDQRARAPPTWSPRSPTPTWTRCRSSRSPARSPPATIGTDAFQEADIRGITMPITKHNFLVTDPAEIPRDDRRGVLHRLAPAAPARCWSTSPSRRCRRRPTFAWPTELNLPGYRPVTRPHSKQIREAARLILESRRPVLYVGGGVIRARASQGAARAGGADRHPGRHHPDGPRRLPRQPPAAPRHARHARHRRRGRRRCRRAT